MPPHKHTIAVLAQSARRFITLEILEILEILVFFSMNSSGLGLQNAK